MSRKRANGEGTHYITKKGDYCFQRYLDRHDKRLTTYGKTLALAKEKMKLKVETIKEEQRKAANFQVSSDMLFSEWWEYWMIKFKKGKLADTTYDNYESTFNVHMLDSIGKYRLNELSSDILQMFIDNLVREKTAATAKYCFKLIQSCLKKAIDYDHLQKNPCRRIEQPNNDNIKKVRALSKVEQALLTEHARKEPSPEMRIMLFAIATGLRQGEIVKLTWSNIGVDMKQLIVDAGVTRVKNRDVNSISKTKLQVQKPKSKNSTRRITLSIGAIRILKEQKDSLDEIIAFGVHSNELGLVFPTSKGKHKEPKTLYRSFEGVMRKCGIQKETYDGTLSFHSLRHTFATRSLEQKMSIEVLSKLMGHASVKITQDIYVHITDDHMREEVTKIDSIIDFGEENENV